MDISAADTRQRQTGHLIVRGNSGKGSVDRVRPRDSWRCGRDNKDEIDTVGLWVHRLSVHVDVRGGVVDPYRCKSQRDARRTMRAE